MKQSAFDFTQRKVTFDPPFVGHSFTSREAAEAIKPDAGTLRERVYQVISEHPGISDERITELTQLNPSTVRPRRIELERAGRIQLCGFTRTKSGRKAQAWKAA